MTELLNEQMELYLAGEMDDAGKMAFEQQLQTDEALAQQFSLYKNIQEEMMAARQHYEGEKKLKANLQSLSSQYFSGTETTPAKVVNMKRKWYYAAASIAAAVLMFIFLKPALFPVNNQEIYARYAIPESLSVQRGAVADSICTVAAGFYNNHQYAQAKPQLQQCLTAQPNKTEVQLAYSICLLELKEYNTALNTFKAISEGNSLLKQRAVWWMALTYLKQDLKGQAIEMLQSIPADAPDYEKAQQLLKEIR
jgi:tetratricopeptide (TPR) repeat protein